MNNLDRWKAMHIPVNYGPQFEAAANKIKANKTRYQAVEKLTGVPWQVIGVIHLREGNCDFGTYLGNGQSLTRKTTIVPKGRGPFSSWEDGAVDALVNAPPKAASNKDWSIGGTLNKLEEFNGLGYRSKGVPSPYLWAHTDQYVSGKYVADHVYDPNVVDSQLGCAGVLKFLGYSSGSAPVTTIAATTAAGGAVAIGQTGYLPSLGQFVHNHWVALIIGAIVVGIVVDLCIDLYRKNKNVVN